MTDDIPEISPAEARAALADIHAELQRTPTMLDDLQAAILAGDMTTSTALLARVRDFFAVLEAMMQSISLDEDER
jgi:hypothetical protein